jgi:hypothetical protein
LECDPLANQFRLKPFAIDMPHIEVSLENMKEHVRPFRCANDVFMKFKMDGLHSETYRARFNAALNELYKEEEDQLMASDDELPSVSKAFGMFSLNFFFSKY